MRKNFFIISFLFILFFAPVLSFAQAAGIDDNFSPPMQAGRFLASYVTALLNKGNNSFPGDEANVVLQTKDGYMWFGGYNGLYRYDGSRFTVWDAVSPNGFGSSNIRALYEDAEGTLWIGTNDKGLVSYRNGIFKTYDRSAGLPSNTIRTICEDRDGRIFCGTPEGIFFIDSEEKINLLYLDTSIVQAVISLCFDSRNNLFAVFNSGELFVYSSDGLTYRHPHTLPFSVVNNVSAGRVAAGTRRGEVFILQFDGANGVFLRSEEKSTMLRIIESVYEDSNGYIWLAAENGIGYFDNSESYHHIGDPSGVGFYTSVLEDYQNGYWITATRGGITRLTLSAFTDFNALFQIDTGGANALIIDGDDYYIGTNDGLFVIDKNGNPSHQSLSSLISGRVRSISRDSLGNLWICTYSDHGVIRYTPQTGSIAFWTPEDGMPTDRTRLAHELPNGVMAIATAVGISFIKDDIVVSVNEALDTDVFIELPDIMVLTLITCADGTLYAGTDGSGVYAISGNGTTRYREEDGLTGGVVMRMHANPAQNGVWAAASPGLCYIDGDKKTVREIDKVPPYTFFDILQYNDELILLTSEMIIFTNADDLLNEELPFEYSSAGQSSGLHGQINANSWNVLSGNGDLFFCTTTGCKFLFKETSGSNIIPNAGIAKILIDGTEYAGFWDGINIPKDADRITFELSLLSFGLFDDAVLCYKLSGYNNETVVLYKGDSFDVSYTNLSGGHYVLQVWTEDMSGNTGNLIEINLFKEMRFFDYGIAWVVVVIWIVIITALVAGVIARYRIREYAKLSELKLEAVTARLEKEKAEESARAKGEFVAVISHELRTPMNAINGMAEILLRSDLSDQAREYVRDIKKAGNSLLVLINDILDISKIEAGKLEINPVNYKLSSLLNDTINIIRVRIMEKSIQFYTDIDESIPNNLTGDDGRIRQILLNLLSNAVKFTDRGYVKLVISAEDRNEKEISLKISVEDTGRGIKPEDMEKLFGDFVQVDTKYNRSVQGTGLGLAISKKLCAAMGGSISVRSEYGKGSVFTALIPQLIDAPETLGESNFKSKPDGEGYKERSTLTRYILPRSRLLVVDDLPANLKVAEGLLAPYKALVDVCTSGLEAVELVKYKKYDIIFMDHLMPEMDGIEAAKLIRAWEQEQKTEKTPIVALSANAVLGLREMYAENGLDDFLAKPIDVFKLDEMLMRWIPGEKREEIAEQRQNVKETEAVFEIPGIDVKQGIALTGGTVEMYRQVLNVYSVNVKERLAFLKTLPDNDTLRNFIVQVHSLKSACATIGAAEAAIMAEELENSGNAGNLEEFREKLSAFAEYLTKLLKNINMELSR